MSPSQRLIAGAEPPSPRSACRRPSSRAAYSARGASRRRSPGRAMPMPSASPPPRTGASDGGARRRRPRVGRGHAGRGSVWRASTGRGRCRGSCDRIGSTASARGRVEPASPPVGASAVDARRPLAEGPPLRRRERRDGPAQQRQHRGRTRRGPGPASHASSTPNSAASWSSTRPAVAQEPLDQARGLHGFGRRATGRAPIAASTSSESATRSSSRIRQARPRDQPGRPVGRASAARLACQAARWSGSSSSPIARVDAVDQRAHRRGGVGVQRRARRREPDADPRHDASTMPRPSRHRCPRTLP